MQRRNKRDRRATQYINHSLRASLPEPTLDLGSNLGRYNALLDLICSNEANKFTGTAHTRIDELEQLLARLSVLEDQSRMLLETGNHQHLNALDSSMTQTRKAAERVENLITSELDDRRKEALARPITDFFPLGWESVLAGVWTHSMNTGGDESLAKMHVINGLHKLGHFASVPKDQETTKIDMMDLVNTASDSGNDMLNDSTPPSDTAKWFHECLMHPVNCGDAPECWEEWQAGKWNPPEIATR